MAEAFTLTTKQVEANRLLGGEATHVMLFGGSRSGKTFLLCRAIAVRALKAAGSRHAILRYRFNHAKASIWHDTFPKMMKLCFPDVKLGSNQSDWFFELPGGSQVWIGGLDDKDRTEKVLGNEYATILLNECSQISFGARETVRTRLAQNVGLKLKMYYDENPPMRTHWTHRLFIEKRLAEPPYTPLSDPDNYASLLLNPKDNAANLPDGYLNELQALSPRKKARFFEGLFGDETEGGLWSYEVLERSRVNAHPDLQRVVVAVDPSGTKGEDDERSDEVGIVVAGLGVDGHAYVLEDRTVNAPPAVWGRIAVTTAMRHAADVIVGEVNYGGAMVEHVVKTAAAEQQVSIRYKEVRASRGKVVRAEPAAALYEQGKVHHVGLFPELEDQMCAFTTAGYMGDRSPDRADALVWALAEIFPGIVRQKSEATPQRRREYAGAQGWMR